MPNKKPASERNRVFKNYQKRYLEGTGAGAAAGFF